MDSILCNFDHIEKENLLGQQALVREQITLLKWSSAIHQCQGIVIAPMDFGVSDTVEQLKNNIYTIYVD
ncbi:MAG: hypothetical protein JKY76_04225 [Proteobacteria bacterium]|nr:hypothetical protein [Pseudomonadota bacterium]